jgi:hypothetical protein
MRTTIIPAQITTVEDKIAGSLNMTQILLMITPILVDALIYVALYPQNKINFYKSILMLIITAFLFLLALRIKGKIVLIWLTVLIIYQLRPKYYLFNKNSLYQRETDFVVNESIKNKLIKKEKIIKTKNLDLSIIDLIKLEKIMNSNKLAVNFHFKDK